MRLARISTEDDGSDGWDLPIIESDWQLGPIDEDRQDSGN